ncbi:hypothetical protein LshimejAT787_0210690 [Lyophyllum shimeji]|uniref:Uncharacterized protein n=1 Tax=Lyophyllum shimeji TaxID=47721 RepID=A0A9P3PHE9_LYOSH|nr:hypothetical protein LshimejAT787_0210690 [Lyophyllum shimeji]
MLLDIKNLLRADEPMPTPMPKPKSLRAHQAPRKAKAAVPAAPTSKLAGAAPRRSSMRSMASELDNFPGSLADFTRGFGPFNAELEHQLIIQAWKAAVRAVPEDPEFTFPAPAPPPPTPANDYMHGLVVHEDSDLSTLFGSECTDASTDTIKVVDLFSLDEILSKKNGFIPPLIIHQTDLIGDRHLRPKHDGFMFYDISSDPLHHLISCRSVSGALPRVPSQAFFKTHAVRVFHECPGPRVPGIENGPFYKYIGDYYVHRTERYLPREEWKRASEEIKDIFVRRFVEANNNKVDNYRTSYHLTKEYVRDLFDRGHMFPLVLLKQAHHPHPEPSSSLESCESALPSPTASSASLGALSSAVSVYSEESAPRDDPEDVDEECPYELYSAASGLEGPPARRPLITYEADGAQVIHLDCHDGVSCYTEQGAGVVSDESPVLGKKRGDASEVFYDDQGNVLKSVFEHDDDEDYLRVMVLTLTSTTASSGTPEMTLTLR